MSPQELAKDPEDSGSTNDAVTLEALALVRGAFAAARMGEAGALADSIQQGVPVDVCNEAGDSLLMLASYHGHHEATRWLVSHGADVELANARNLTPLMGAAFHGDRKMVHILLGAGAVATRSCPDGKSAIDFAAMFNRRDALEALLDAAFGPAVEGDREESSSMTDSRNRVELLTNAVHFANSMNAEDSAALLTSRLKKFNS